MGTVLLIFFVVVIASALFVWIWDEFHKGGGLAR